jgi:lipoprotein-releasing system ATP-binding protein
MLKLENISKSYPQRGFVLENLSLEVNDGDSVSITGPSGSGKSTLMNIIGSLETPDTGDVICNGKSILNLNPDESALYRNRNVGFVFQDHLLLPHLTVKENIILPLFAADMTKEEYNEKQDFAKFLMERTGISELSIKYPGKISGGEAQRIALVRALVNKPSLLLADEPTGSLDSGNASIMALLLKELNRELGITLIITTHSEYLASGMKRHLKLENGKLVN